MAFAHFVFDTDDFIDPPDILAQNINGIRGHALASFLSSSLQDNASMHRLALQKITPGISAWSMAGRNITAPVRSMERDRRKRMS